MPAFVFSSSGRRQKSALCIQPERLVYQALVALNETLRRRRGRVERVEFIFGDMKFVFPF